MIRKPFLLGDLELPSNIFCAPLAGCSDLPFRKMTSRYKPGMIYCEMVKIDALVRHDPHTYRLLDYTRDMHPIGAQICGSKPKLAFEAARIIEDLGFDLIDLNCGCPVDKVTKDGSGSGLLQNPERIGEILTEMVRAVSIPVTVKIRAGWDDESINAAEIVKIAESAGASALTVHGRTREQGYKGPANWDHVAACKRASSKMPIIGNGDLFDAEAVERLFSHSGCDGVLIARGTMGQPWIVEDIERHLLGLPKIERTILDLRQVLLDHFHSITSYQAERQALLDMRRVGCWYLKPCSGAKQLRMQINQASSLDEVFSLLDAFDWGTIRFSQDASFASASF